MNSDYGDSDINKYNIDAVIETKFPNSVPAAISAAVAKMQNVITGDTDNIVSDRIRDVCTKKCTKDWPEEIDDIHICFQDVPLPNQVVATAGTFCSWTSGNSKGTVINGVVQINENEVQKRIADGTFFNVVEHELHVSIVMLTLMFS